MARLVILEIKKQCGKNEFKETYWGGLDVIYRRGI